MKKSNVILQTAIAAALLGAAGSASANIGVASRTFAVEQFLGTTPNATALALAPVSYQFNGPVAAASTFYVYVALSGGATYASAPAATTLVGAASDGSGISSTAGNTTGGSITAVTLSNDATYARFTVALSAGKALSTASVFTFTPVAGSVVNASTLASTANTITANWVNNSTATTGTLPAGDVDTGGTHTGVVAASGQGITLSAASSANYPFNSGGVPETAKINLAATPISTLFTAPGGTVSNANSTTVINLGAIRATDGTALSAAGTAYNKTNQSSGATPLSYTLTAPAGFFAPLATSGTVALFTTAACTGASLGTSASTVFASVSAAAAATTLGASAAASPADATNYYICMTVSGNTTIVAGTPSLTATYSHANSTTDSNETIAATNLYTLATNGSTVTVRSYIPAVTVGYSSFVRIINTGAVASTVTGQWLYEDGTTGTAATLITPALAVGAAKTLTSAQIEAALGAPTVSGTTPNNRPRLRLTATTNGLEAQSFFLNPGNIFSTMHGSDGTP